MKRLPKESLVKIETGQVWAHHDYYKVITNVSANTVSYKFYNRKEYFYPPNKRRRLLNVGELATPFECWELTTDFINHLKDARLTLMEIHFAKKPLLGIFI